MFYGKILQETDGGWKLLIFIFSASLTPESFKSSYVCENIPQLPFRIFCNFATPGYRNNMNHYTWITTSTSVLHFDTNRNFALVYRIYV